MFLVPPTHEDPINKSEENARLEVNQPARPPAPRPGGLRAAGLVSGTCVWHSISLTVLSPSILTLAGSVCEGDKRRRHSFPRFLASPCNKRKNCRDDLPRAQTALPLCEPSALSRPPELRKRPGSLLLEEGRRGVPGICSKMPGRGAVGFAHWFSPRQLCDLGKVASPLCASNLLICKTGLRIPPTTVIVRLGWKWVKGLRPVSDTHRCLINGHSCCRHSNCCHA